MCSILNEMNANMAVTAIGSVSVEDSKRGHSFEFLIKVVSELGVEFHASVTVKKKEDLKITKENLHRFKGQTATIEVVRGKVETCLIFQSDDGKALLEVCSEKMMGIAFVKKSDFSEADLNAPPINHLPRLASEDDVVARRRNRGKVPKIRPRVVTPKKQKPILTIVG